MPRLSRTELIWQAPTQNVDGTDIDYALDYELGVDAVDGFTPVLTVVGTLQADGRYSAPLDQMAWDFGDYNLALRAINRDVPTDVSVWSNSVPLVVADPTPAAPVLFAV